MERYFAILGLLVSVPSALFACAYISESAYNKWVRLYRGAGAYKRSIADSRELQELTGKSRLFDEMS